MVGGMGGGVNEGEDGDVWVGIIVTWKVVEIVLSSAFIPISATILDVTTFVA